MKRLGSLASKLFDQGYKRILFVLLLALVTVVACAPDCGWSGKAQAWIDDNGNGVWDAGELPLSNVMFYVDDTDHDLRDVAGNAVSDSNGQAYLSVWLPGQTCGTFEVYAEAPASYELTTPERVAHPGQEPFQFGYRYRAGLATPTPASPASLYCTSYLVGRGSLQDFHMDVGVAPNGDVWVATNEGVHRYRGPDRTHTVYTTEDGLPEHTPRTLGFGADGTVWVGTNGGAARFDGQSWTPYTTANGLAHDTIDDIAVDASGTVWFFTQYGISAFEPGTNTWHANAIDFNLVRRWPLDMPIEAAPDGALWLFPADKVYRLELAALSDGSPLGASHLRSVDGFSALTNIQGATAGEDLLWVFGWGEGGPVLIRFDPATGQGVVFDHTTTGGAMFGGGITDLAVAPHGSVWLTYAEDSVRAVHMFSAGSDPAGATWIEYGPKNGLTLGAIVSVAVEPEGAIWIGTDGGTVARCTESR